MWEQSLGETEKLKVWQKNWQFVSFNPAMNKHKDKEKKKQPQHWSGTLMTVAISFAPSYQKKSQVTIFHSQCSASKDINICTIFRKKIHIECAESVIWKQVHSTTNISLSLS